MSKHDKTLARLCSKPTPSNISWKDLSALLKHLGYTEIKGNGSRRKFHHVDRNALICCHEPHPHPDVDKGCINDVVEHLTVHKFIR